MKRKGERLDIRFTVGMGSISRMFDILTAARERQRVELLTGFVQVRSGRFELFGRLVREYEWSSYVSHEF